MAGMQETDHLTLKNGVTYLLQDTKARAQLADLLVEVMEKYGADNPPPYPVTSVNGETGDVNIPTVDLPVSVQNGGTGATTAQDAIANLGIKNVTDLHITATAESGINIRSINFYQIGRIIFGYIYFDATSAIPNGSRIATLNSRLAAPYGAYATAAVHSGADSSGMVYISRGVTNQIKAWGPIPVGYEYYAEFMYVLA